MRNLKIYWIIKYNRQKERAKYQHQPGYSRRIGYFNWRCGGIGEPQYCTAFAKKGVETIIHPIISKLKNEQVENNDRLQKSETKTKMTVEEERK